MIGINNIGIFVPDEKIDTSARAKNIGLDENFVSNKIGVEHLSIFENITIPDACNFAFEDLLSKTDLDISSIDCIVLCTQNPDFNGLPHNSALIQSKIGAGTHAACFDIGLGCSGYVHSLSIIKAFMEGNGFKNGLLFTCDPYSKIINEEDKNTALLFGDAATVTLLNNSPKYTIEQTSFFTDGKNHANIINDNGTFVMNGRQVYNFVMSEVPKQIKQLLSDNKIEDKNIDMYLLHQGSKFMVQSASRKITDDISKVPFDIKSTGNTVSSSIPLLFSKFFQQDQKNIIVCGFGVGLSISTALLKQTK